MFSVVILFIVIFCVFSAQEIIQFAIDLSYEIGYQPAMPKTPDTVKPELESLISKYESGQISVIDLSTIKTFSWDRLLIFQPYASPHSINPKIGRSWHTIDSCIYAVGRTSNSEGYGLLVFLYGSKIVHCSLYKISDDMPYFYLTDSEIETGFSRQEALFTISGNRLINVPRK